MRMRLAGTVGVALLAGVLVLAVRTAPIRLEPGSGLWQRAVLGAGSDGRLVRHAVIRLPGVGRQEPLQLRVEAADEGAAVALSVAVDRKPVRWVRLPRTGPAVLTIPPAGTPGLRLDLQAVEGASPPRLLHLELERTTGLPWGGALLAALLLATAMALLSARLSAGLALALGLFLAAVLGLAASPLLLWWSLASPASWLRLGAVLVALCLSLLVAGRAGELRRFVFGAGLLAALVFGTWVRGYFLPSAGSWDVEYWKACALRGNSHGVTRVYGGPDAVPPGHFLAQLRGDEPQWQLEALGQSFVVDQPPGIQAAWAASWWGVDRLRRAVGMDRSEALNVAAKLPATIGDVLAVGLLLLAVRDRRWGAVLAALYWALPISWLSSAVLGFFDGAPAPLAVAALLLAGRGRATAAGALLALAALLKATVLMMAPAAAMALWMARASLRRAILTGLGIVAAVLLPFALDGTLDTAVVHVYRILFQERLSGGFANAWWLLGAVTAAGQGTFTWSDPVPFVRVDALSLPLSPLGTLAMALLVGWLTWLQRRCPGPRVAALAGFVAVYGYAMVAIGVHENHPHLFVLSLLATGLASRRLRLIAAILLTTYCLNMLALSGLGRFYGSRYMALEPLLGIVEGLRTGLGFDITLLLALVNVSAFAWLLLTLRQELDLHAEPAAGSSKEGGSS